MGRSIPITILGVEYPNLSAAKRLVGDPLYKRYGDKKKWPHRVADENDIRLLVDLFRICVEKKGQDFYRDKIGIRHFSHFEADYDGRPAATKAKRHHCFSIVDTEGNREHWSMFNAFKGNQKRPGDRSLDFVPGAFRRAINDRKFNIRRDFLPQTGGATEWFLAIGWGISLPEKTLEFTTQKTGRLRKYWRLFLNKKI